MASSTQPRVLLTGPTGYVGGRMIRPLEAKGVRLRCMARYAKRLEFRVQPETELISGDVLDPESLRSALADVDVAYYLVHSMGDSGDFEEKERRAATNFAAAAREAGVRRIVYLGGLGRGTDLSPHLASRQEVGRILAASGVETIEFRCSVIIGSGSLSFELIRALVNHLPVMVTPSWVRLPTSPIAVEDVVAYLTAAIDLPAGESRVFEIGSPEAVSYAGLMREYARQRGLHRLLIPVPVLTPYLSSLWLGLVTPVYARVGRKLIDSIRNETVVRDRTAEQVFGIHPRSVSQAIERAMEFEDRELAETHWYDSLSSKGELQRYGGVRFHSRLIDSRSHHVKLPCEAAFRPIERIGGRNGWYFANWLWNIRGFLDLLAGGVGVRRGRRHPTRLQAGDAVDWWRVQEIEPGRMLRLFAEMKVPGRAWLQFEVTSASDGGSTIYQTAIFDPLGLPGLLYWYGIYPIHAVVFRGMIRAIARRAVELEWQEGGGLPSIAERGASGSGD